MYSDNDLVNFIKTHSSYDLRISGNGRWLDQKCTPDVISTISDCIVDYYESTGKNSFSSQDIWHSDYAEKYVSDVFKKPNVNSSKATSEYNKFFMQPMETLAYAGVLTKTKIKNRNIYKIENLDLLKYCALREKNSLKFLAEYITKVMKDSGLYYCFDNFFNLQTANSYFDLKDAYSNFIIAHTKINGKVEVNRIFAKVINPLAYVKNSVGSERGRKSKDVITFDMLMYNRENFRDLWNSKPKGKTRKEHANSQTADARHYAKTKVLGIYLINRAKKYVRRYNVEFNGGMPEISMYSSGVPGNQVHHIFPVEHFPMIADYFENLICIDPSQHFYYAHPNNDTHRINKDFQALLLVAKSETIEKDYACSRKFYDFGKFITVLKTGYSDNSFDNIPNLDFNCLRASIMRYYSTGC